MSTQTTLSRTEVVAGDELKEMLARAERGDRAVLPQLRAWLDANPDYWRKAGDVAQVAELAWVGLVAAGNLANEESVKRKLADLKKDVAGSAPSPLEKLLADRVAVCWLQAWYADGLYAQMRTRGVTDPRFFKAAEERQESSQRRLVAAAKALATVQKLLPRARPVEVTLQSAGKRCAAQREDRRGRKAWSPRRLPVGD